MNKSKNFKSVKAHILSRFTIPEISALEAAVAGER